MSKRYIYDGDPCNLGHFGFVKKGDILVLTDQEERCVIADSDKRFKLAGPTDKQAANFIKITTAMTGKERAEAEAANTAEKARLDNLAKEIDSDRIEILEIKEKTFDQLIALGERINAKVGSAVVDVSKKISRADLITSILSAERRTEKD